MLVVVFCYCCCNCCFYNKLLLLPTAIREITFGDVTLLLLFRSDDLNVILVIDNLFELLLFEPVIELTLFILLILLMFLGLTCCFDMLFILVLLLSNPLLPTTLGLNVSAANDYLHSFSYFQVPEEGDNYISIDCFSCNNWRKFLPLVIVLFEVLLLFFIDCCCEIAITQG